MKKLLSVLLCLCLLLSCGCRFFPSKEPETTTEEPTELLTDINGKEVPVFENVGLTTLDASKFVVTENGRRIYDDPAYDCYTGVDVSVFQGDIDWNAVAADGISFTMLRLGGRGYGEGALYEDTNFVKNFEAASAAGLKIGVYFFSQAVTVEEAVQEAKFVVEILNGMPLDLPVAYDWEHVDDTSARTCAIGADQVTSFAKAFCDTVTQAGYQAIVYFNREHGYYNYELSLISDYFFWYAEYADRPSFVYDYHLWQYTESGRVNGIPGNVDLNIAVYASSG